MRRKADRFTRHSSSPRGSKRSPDGAAARRGSRPQFEPLEDRTLMWGTPLPEGISYSLGTVNINATDSNDSAAVVMEAGQIKVTLSHTQYVQIDINTTVQMTFNEPDKFYDPAVVHNVYFFGKGGNDYFRNDTSVPSQAQGNGGSDELVGGGGNDKLYGGDDADVLEGRGGNDELNGGPAGDSYVFSGRALGWDSVTEGGIADIDELDLTGFGQIPARGGGTVPLSTGATIDLASTGWQTVNAGNLTLTLSDAAGLEVVRGTVRGDTITGNARGNTFYGFDGDDDLQGRGGNDFIYAGAGSDRVRGEDGNDWLYGGGGDDVLRGDTGSDHQYGEHGNDTLYGSLDGKCWLGGGDGNDTLISVGNATNDALGGGTGFDSFWCDAPPTETISDADAAETAARHVHRIGSYVALKTDDGMTVTDYGSPGLARNGPSLADPLKQSSNIGTLMNFSANPLFPGSGPSRDDINQGGVGDCYFLAALASVASTKPDLIRQTVADLGDGTYAVNFHGAGGADAYVRVDADLWTAGVPVYAGFGTDNCMWGPVVEKAYAFYKNAKGTYASINDGLGAGWTTAEALGVPKVQFPTGNYANASDFLTAMREQWLAGKAVVVGGPAPFLPGTVLSNYDDPDTNADESTYRRGAHVYSLVSVAADLSSVTLRNPWGFDGGGDDSDTDDGYVTIPANVLFYCAGSFATYTV